VRYPSSVRKLRQDASCLTERLDSRASYTFVEAGKPAEDARRILFQAAFFPDSVLYRRALIPIHE